MTFRLVKVQSDRVEKFYGNFPSVAQAKKEVWGNWRKSSSLFGGTYWYTKPDLNGQHWRVYKDKD